MRVERRPAKGIRSWWPWVSLLPLGIGSWAPIYAGVRTRMKTWIALGAGWSAITLAGWIGAVSAGKNNSAAGLLLIVGWVGAAATSFVIRGQYEQIVGSPLLDATDRAQQRLSDRRRALELARDNPALALEVGVGRPDRPGAIDVGVVDVNNASVTGLLTLPGVDGDLATRIVEVRAETGGFSTLEDLGATLDLDGGLVESLRGHVVCLPRQSHGRPDPPDMPARPS
jgi:DNA uptake protein ComE-like DNA-binding protein